MKDKLRALNRQYGMFPAGAVVICAVSGGADSMCMLHLLNALAPEWGFSIRCAHFNHHLRGEESLRDEIFVRERCREWGIPFHRGGADVAQQAARIGRGVEETARLLRYEYLEQVARDVGGTRIVTAHTANDNAETVLHHLVRGSGLQGLTGISPCRGMLVRPLLTVTRAEVEEYCALHGIPYVEDSTNTDEGYTRNFLRHRVIPLLEQVNPRAVETLSAAADRLRADNEYLDAAASQAVEEGRMTDEGYVVEARILAELPDPIAARAVRRAMERAGGGKNCTAAHIRALLELSRSADPSARADLPGLTAFREYDRLVLAPTKERAQPPQAVLLQREGETVYGDTGWTVTCRKAVCPNTNGINPDTFFLSCAGLEGDPVLRPRQTGDMIKLPGRAGKTLKKLLIEEKVPVGRRDLLPVLADGRGVLAVAGFGPDVTRLAREGEEALKITFEKVK